MKSFVGVLTTVVLLFSLIVNARHVENEYEETPEAEGESELINRMREHDAQKRHRRRSRQMFGPDYFPSYLYSDYRRDYSPPHRQEEYYSHILKSLDEIISHIKSPPPPPPQPIYIPYPVIQYRPCVCKQAKPAKDDDEFIPELKNRTTIGFGDPRNWGLTIDDPLDLEEDDDSDGSRPISLLPVEPNRPASRPAPPVEHGSSQAGTEQTTKAPTVPRPGPCGAAILSCCSLKEKTDVSNCFRRYNCVKTFATKQACAPNVIKQVLEQFRKAYAPTNSIS